MHDSVIGRRLLRLPDVQAIVGLRRSEIYRRIRNGTFPAPIRLGTNAVAWLQSDLDAWIAARVAESRGSAA
ncbi:MAG: AlpA family transcriptional regulator [Xanthomonadaceae bacterium]|jgi:prophage regulatory protein|nr:AlpA family transcriptional regulator [Xanthomonadaceae bacterium]